MCTKGGGMAIGMPAPYKQPPPAPPLPCANNALGVCGQGCAHNVKASGAAAMTKKSVVTPTMDIGPFGIGGVKSSTLMGSMEFMNCNSSHVKIEGKPAAQEKDKTKHNSANCMNGSWTLPSQFSVVVKG
jgi:hypothetical protein